MFRIFMTLSFRTSLYFFLHDSIAYPESWQCKLPRVGSCEGHKVHKTKKVFIIKTLGFLIDYSNGKVDREEIIATEKRH